MIQQIVDSFILLFHPTKYNSFEKQTIFYQNPKNSLAKQCLFMISKYSCWKKLLLIFFGFILLIFPYIINKMNIEMIKGNGNIRLTFCFIAFSQTIIDMIKAIFMVICGTKSAINFLNTEVFRYSTLSKPTTYKYSASKTMDQDIRDASHSINRFIEWGLQAIVSSIGSVLSCFLILISMTPGWNDITAISILLILFFVILRPIQKKLTENMAKQQKIYHRTRDLLTFRSIEFQNKECKPDEYFQTIEAPFEFSINVDSLFNIAYYMINLTTNIIMLLYAYASDDDRKFAEKYVVISSITNAVRDISQFGNHYRRYCNEYNKYCKMFKDESLQYDEYIPSQDIPQIITIKSVNISRGSHIVSCNVPITIKQGNHYLIRGPSGAGKSTFLDAFLGYLPTIELENKVNIRAYNEQIVVHLQHSSATKLTNVSIYDVFRSTDRDKIRDIIERLIPREKFEIILSNIGRNESESDPFGLYIEDKMSGGEKTRFFLARTLFKALKINAKIIFLDEPEDGQDPDKQIESFKVIHQITKENNITVFWITHLREYDLKETEINFDGGIIRISLDGKITFTNYKKN